MGQKTYTIRVYSGCKGTVGLLPRKRRRKFTSK